MGRKGKASMAGQVPVEDVVGVFKANYLGCVPVDKSRGNDVACDAIERVLAQHRSNTKIFIKVSLQAIALYERKPSDPLTVMALREVSFVCLQYSDKYLCLFHSSRTANIVTCHVCGIKPGARAIAPAIQRAFEKQPTGAPKDAWGGVDTVKERRPAARVTSSTGDNGMEVRVFKAKYFGHTAVSQASGGSIIAGAVQSLKDSLKGHKLKVNVIVSTERIQIVDRKSGDVLQNCPIDEVSFSSMDENDSKVFAFITANRQKVMFCHALKLPNAGELNAAVGTAFVAASDAAKRDGRPETEAIKFARQLTNSSMTKGKSTERDLSAPLGLFEAHYLGSCPITDGRDFDACLEATGELLASQPEMTQVALVVSGEGLKTVEALTSEVMMNTFIRNIIYTTVIDDKKVLAKYKDKKRPLDSLFVFISKNESLGSKSCEVFRAGERAKEITQTINAAFQVALDEHNRRKGDPFAPISQKREPASSKLFRRQIHRRDLAAVRVIGMGQFGEVYLARQAVRSGSGDDGGDYTTRAVKLLRKAATKEDKEEFLREAETMLELDHPNLVRLVGVAVQQRPWLAVMEYMQYGDLRSVLKACDDRKLHLTFLEQLKFCVQIATGMEAMAKVGFVHMDLAARNVLLSSKNVVKIADFGLTRRLDPGKDYYKLRVALKLPIKWMAIESMDEKIFSQKSDVWSFGVTCWEIMSYGRPPYPNIKNIDVQRHIREGVRLKRVTGPEEFHNMLLRCWDPQWRRRPDFEQLRNMILKFAIEAKKTSPPMRDIGSALAKAKLRASQENLLADDEDFTASGPQLQRHNSSLPYDSSDDETSVSSRQASRPQSMGNQLDTIEDEGEEEEEQEEEKEEKEESNKLPQGGQSPQRRVLVLQGNVPGGGDEPPKQAVPQARVLTLQDPDDVDEDDEQQPVVQAPTRVLQLSDPNNEDDEEPASKASSSSQGREEERDDREEEEEERDQIRPAGQARVLTLSGPSGGGDDSIGAASQNEPEQPQQQEEQEDKEQEEQKEEEDSHAVGALEAPPSAIVQQMEQALGTAGATEPAPAAVAVENDAMNISAEMDEEEDC